MAKTDLKIIREYEIPRSRWRAYDFSAGRRVMVRLSESSSEGLRYKTFVSGNKRPSDFTLKSTGNRTVEDSEELRRKVAKKTLAKYLTTRSD